MLMLFLELGSPTRNIQLPKPQDLENIYPTKICNSNLSIL